MKLFLIVLPALILIAGVMLLLGPKRPVPPTLRTEMMIRGDLLISISATGTVEPEEVIDVGAQVAGLILSFGTDQQGKTVDYGSKVTKGMVLARIDDALYGAESAMIESEVESCRANLKRVEAEGLVTRAKFSQAERDWQRARDIGPSEALSQASYDGYRAAYEIAQANLAVAEAAFLQAKADIKAAEARLSRARRNLEYCTITAPVDGIIVDRRVNIGQTVVASLNAPSLFLLAKDLKRMQVWVAVNEADVTKISRGQRVTFTLDALPNEEFSGKVEKVRLNASMTQNVVTYTVEVTTDNSQGRLLPYLTANVLFEVNRRDDVLLAPNAALRFTPPPELVDPDLRLEPPGQGDPFSSPGGVLQQDGAGAMPPGGFLDSAMGILWVQQEDYVRPVEVRTGLTDGLNTEVSGPGLEEGALVVTGMEFARQGGPEKKNPFMSTMPSPPGGGGGQGPPR